MPFDAKNFMAGSSLRAIPSVTAVRWAILAMSWAHAESFFKTMAAGSKLKLAGYNTVNADCSSAGYAVVRILNQPAHGTPRIATGVTCPHHASSDPHSLCNVRRVPSVNVEYSPEKGFLGSDYVVLEAIFPSGTDRTDSYAIEVK
jgi:hypothetical protein